MKSTIITGVTTRDMRFRLRPGEGSDAVHINPEYSFAITNIGTSTGIAGSGLVLTMGCGNDLVCRAIDILAEGVKGYEINDLMAEFGDVFRVLADHHQLRWLGPHKGVVHLALASLTNACFDLWAKSHGLPLWRLLLDQTPEQIVQLCDLSYVEDVLSRREAIDMMKRQLKSRPEREKILKEGYPAYDTSIGWLNYDDAQLRANVMAAMSSGFGAVKLKVGGKDLDRDVRRAELLRSLVGPSVSIMLDANQQWQLPQAVTACKALSHIDPFWIEEPTHPDDLHGHEVLAAAIRPIRIAAGEHIANRIAFKNYLQSGCLSFIQVDCTRVGGVSEFLTTSLLAEKFGRPVVPHVGDMGQIHQHLVLFNHIAIGQEKLFLEHIPHLQQYFVNPIRVNAGVFETPQEPGASCDLVPHLQ